MSLTTVKVPKALQSALMASLSCSKVEAIGVIVRSFFPFFYEIVDRCHDDVDRGVIFLDLACQVVAAAVRKADIHKYDIGLFVCIHAPALF